MPDDASDHAPDLARDVAGDLDQRIERVERELRRQSEALANHQTQNRTDAAAWREVTAEHDRRLALIGPRAHRLRSLLEDLHFDFDVLAQDLRRLFANTYRRFADDGTRH